MDASSTAQIDGDVLEKIKQRITVITALPAPQSGYTITSLNHNPSTPSSIFQIQASYISPSLLQTHLLSALPSHLSLPAEDIHVVISVKSGTEQAEVTFEHVIKPVLCVVGLDETRYTVLRTESSDTLKHFASGPLRDRAILGVKQTVLLLSGDGGVVDIVNNLLRDGIDPSSAFVRPAIVLFPLGTGNALFHSLHRPIFTASSTSSDQTPSSDLALALRTLLFGTQHSLPGFRAVFSPGARLLSNSGLTALSLPHNTLYGSVVISYGLHATLVADSDTPEWRKHGSARFGLVARELLASPHAYKAEVTLWTSDGQQTKVVERLEHGYILLTLVSSLEKSFTISPASKPLDGKLRIIHFGPEAGEEVGRLMGLAYQGGKHVEEEKVAYEVVKRLGIEFLERDGDEGGKDAERRGRWRRVCVDGLIVRVEEGGWVEVSKVPEDESVVDIVVAPEIGPDA